MRVQVSESCVVLHATGAETYDWANRPGAAWPCSTLSGRKLFAAFDSNGLFDTDGDEDIDGHEFSACCADLLHDSGKVSEDHPAYFVAIGQHREA